MRCSAVASEHRGTQPPALPAHDSGGGQLLRLARRISLMTFRLRSGTRINAMTFAAIIPGACRNGADRHESQQQQPFSIDRLHFHLSLATRRCKIVGPRGARRFGLCVGAILPPSVLLVTRSAAPPGPAMRHRGRSCGDRPRQGRSATARRRIPALAAGRTGRGYRGHRETRSTDNSA
jgi:hypothetical protein